MSALEQILSIPSIKIEHPRLYSEAVKELEELRKAAEEIAAKQSVERTPVDIGDGVMVDPLILGAILD